MDTEQKWFALTAKHQHEANVARLLGAKGLSVFHPTFSTLHQWRDRKKLLELPLFPGYVFFAESHHKRSEILSTPGVFSIVSFGNQPAQIPSEELDGIRRASESGRSLQPHDFLSEGDRVKVKRGPLAGLCGILQRHKDSYRLVISIELLGRAAAVEIDAVSVDRVS